MNIPENTDTERLDFLLAHPETITALGKNWYVRASYGMPVRKCKTLREAIDIAILMYKGI